MAFDSLDCGTTFPSYIVWRGQSHKLLITTRDIPEAQLDYAQWQALISATKYHWLRIATLYDKAVETLEKGEEADWAFNYPAPYETCEFKKTISPHVTIVNHSYETLTITVTSNDNGQSVIHQLRGQLQSDMEVREKMPTLFENIKYPRNNPNPPASGQVGSSSNPIGKRADEDDNESSNGSAISDLKCYIRGTRKGMADNLIGIETGKAKSPTWNQAMLHKGAYDYKNIRYDNGVYVAYQVGGAIAIQKYTNDDGNETISASIPVATGGAIRIFDRGGESNFDWGSLAQHLGVPKVGDSVAAGLREYVGKAINSGAAYIVMKVNGNFLNYTGLYAAPSEGAE